MILEMLYVICGVHVGTRVLSHFEGERGILSKFSFIYAFRTLVEGLIGKPLLGQ